MKIKSICLSLASLIALSEAKSHTFKVISIMGEGYSMGVKYGTTVKPLTSSIFPLFTGNVEADNITQYKYVALDAAGQVVEEEGIVRNYSDENSNINEVYNRANKEVNIPKFPELFKPMFPMGADNFKPLPDNVIYNVYAKCDPNGYEYITSKPFDPPGTQMSNKTPVNCTISIVSPHHTFQSSGNIRIIGFGSRLYKKLTYAIKLDKKFMGRKAFRLRAMANDPTLIRENLTTNLYKSVGVPVQTGSYARLFINGDTYGLYSFIDSISKKWIAGNVHGNAKAKVGISYKLYTDLPLFPDFHYHGDNYEEYSRFYRPDEFEEEDVNPNDESSKYTRLIDFIKLYDQWVNTPGQPLDQLKKFLNIEALLRLLVIDTLTLGVDNFYFRLSNAALYYNPERNNYVFLPYDFDKTLRGSSGDEELDEATYLTDCHTWVNQHEEVIDHYFTNNILANPEVKKRYDVLLVKSSLELFNEKVVSGYVHAVADLIRDDIEWNFEKSISIPIPYDGIVNHYTIEHFNTNLEQTPVEYLKPAIIDDEEFGLLQWVQLRSQNCISDTANVDISVNENISDNLQVSVYTGVASQDDDKKKGNSKSSGFMITPSIKSTLGRNPLKNEINKKKERKKEKNN
ncbi:hypothetical protein PIROE2DRAFT_3213 [Piromyces sp. E2]|nr:hypothetical protein PIROE2DRAFT_3213 [Piromyces sp. E2]|eukprot:OUM68980.1 hypothetical protein PIROE2DRAFT_3213 [Piromyces sp. E2]